MRCDARTRFECDEARDFATTEASMRSIGFDEAAMQRIWMLLSVVLKFGNLRFGAGEEAQRPVT